MLSVILILELLFNLNSSMGAAGISDLEYDIFPFNRIIFYVFKDSRNCSHKSFPDSDTSCSNF